MSKRKEGKIEKSRFASKREEGKIEKSRVCEQERGGENREKQGVQARERSGK